MNVERHVVLKTIKGTCSSSVLYCTVQSQVRTVRKSYALSVTCPDQWIICNLGATSMSHKTCDGSASRFYLQCHNSNFFSDQYKIISLSSFFYIHNWSSFCWFVFVSMKSALTIIYPSRLLKSNQNSTFTPRRHPCMHASSLSHTHRM